MLTNRRNFLKTSSGAIATTALLSMGSSRLLGHNGDHPSGSIIGHGDRKYRVNNAWGNLNPNQFPIINCHAMVESESGRLYTLTDVKANNIIVYEPDGTFVESMDLEYSGGHGIDIAKEGDEEFLYIADGGWANRYGRKVSNETGRIAKTDLKGRLVFTIGHPQTIGVYKPGQSFKPCDIAVAPNGDIYVADGYGSQCVLHYDKHGQYINHWGGKDDPVEARRLNGSHGVSVDLRKPDSPILLVASREANRIKRFTMDGDYIDEFYLPGAFAGQLLVQGDHAYTGVCWSKKDNEGGRLPKSGFVIVLDKDNQVVSCPGGEAPVYKDGVLQPLNQAPNAPFKHVHDLCVDREENIYVCQWNAGGAYPIKLELV
ncbi:MAG: 6-bladed beta-propeller [Verrucomicrobiota bacterium]